MSQAIQSGPFSVYIGDGATPEVFSRIPEVGDIKAPKGTAEEIDVSSHDSAAKEFLLGLSDGGECSFPINFIPGDTAQQALYDASKSKALVNFQIKDDDVPSMTLAFAARVKEFPFVFPVSGAVTTDVVLRVSGDPILTVPSE